MKITIVGSGHIGGGLGRAWARKGHAITYAARDPSSAELLPLLKETGGQALPLGQALEDAQVVVLATPFAAVAAIASAKADWRGQLVIDCTNAIGPGPALLHGHTDSAAEVNARLMPGALVVKSFTAQGAENLTSPFYGDVAATNFYCGDDEAAKHQVHRLIEDIGFEPLDVGPLRAARFLEPMTLLWFAAAQATGSRQIAFKLLRA
ncbi:MAG: NAD(P)-binding domain-containing protein [Rhizobacter sp.]